MHLDQPPMLTPLTATPTTCDYDAKSALDAKHQSDSSNLYRDYQNTLAQINIAGAVNSSATQMALAAYTSEKNRIDHDYASQLEAIHCK